jgi:hypothetical protein
MIVVAATDRSLSAFSEERNWFKRALARLVPTQYAVRKITGISDPNWLLYWLSPGSPNHRLSD